MMGNLGHLCLEEWVMVVGEEAEGLGVSQSLWHGCIMPGEVTFCHGRGECLSEKREISGRLYQWGGFWKTCFITPLSNRKEREAHQHPSPYYCQVRSLQHTTFCFFAAHCGTLHTHSLCMTHTRHVTFSLPILAANPSIQGNGRGAEGKGEASSISGEGRGEGQGEARSW